MTRPHPTAVAVRAVVVLGGVLVAVAAPDLGPTLAVLLVVGVAATLAAPARIGSGPALAAAAAAFLLTPTRPVATTALLVGAAGVYLLHTGTAFVATCPWDARVTRGVVVRWAQRCVPAVVLTALAAALDAGLGTLPATPLLAVGAALLAVVAAFGLVRVFARAPG